MERLSWAYLMRSTSNNLFKIGRSSIPSYRHSAINREYPGTACLGLMETIEGEDVRLEYSLHKEFADKRITGEWFDLDYNDVKSILARCDVIFPIEENHKVLSEWVYNRRQNNQPKQYTVRYMLDPVYLSDELDLEAARALRKILYDQIKMLDEIIFNIQVTNPIGNFSEDDIMNIYTVLHAPDFDRRAGSKLQDSIIGSRGTESDAVWFAHDELKKTYKDVRLVGEEEIDHNTQLVTFQVEHNDTTIQKQYFLIVKNTLE